MAIESAGNSTATMDRLEIKYLEWDPENSAVSIHMHPGVMDGIARDVIEGLEASNRVRLEVGGLLLGRVEPGPRPAVWIEQYQRIACEHHFGPQFVLDSKEITALEESAKNILSSGDLAVVGLYRSNTRPRFQLDESDVYLIKRYFSDPSDLILLIKAEHGNGTDGIFGQFHAWDKTSGSHRVGGKFPFGGDAAGTGIAAEAGSAAGAAGNHVAAGSDIPAESDTQDAAATNHEREGTGDRDTAPTAPSAKPEHPRRLVPDYSPPPVEPAPSLYGLSQKYPPHVSPGPDDITDEFGPRESLKKWLPLFAALLVAVGIFWVLLQPGARIHLPFNPANPAPARNAGLNRPIGLYVDPAGPTWRVLWNAAALRDARSVQLFVRDKDDQNRIDLSARDLASASYEYRPVGNDVTFRLEVVDKSGLVSAESFRLIQPAPPVTPTPAPAHDTASSPTSSPTEGVAQITQPRATYKAPPVVAAGVRARIRGTVSVDVRVHIDTHGRVVSAAPVTKLRSGLDQYLAGRAVHAARLWRFEPARENGTPVAGTSTIHFTFEK